MTPGPANFHPQGPSCHGRVSTVPDFSSQFCHVLGSSLALALLPVSGASREELPSRQQEPNRGSWASGSSGPWAVWSLWDPGNPQQCPCPVLMGISPLHLQTDTPRADVGEDDEKPKDIIRFTAETLSVEEVSRLVTSPLCGAVSLFVGTTRNHFEGKKVISLEYEAYIPMAENEVRRICGDVRRKWPVRHIAVFHRLGLVPVSEASVVIAVSSAHRAASLGAVSYAIDALKAKVPVWKKGIEPETRAYVLTGYRTVTAWFTGHCSPTEPSAEPRASLLSSAPAVAGQSG
ncbi:Molybdopterin synthase catalytic subunit [Myotis brandtii]|uniref:Molybdopterin synthase catalytic subunit n=1 Tax=Myotis brandtii TaxID=109478 RepID=S7N120_MYOBR|nr:Molybdopterin synthase catalytic subunit [Myotis brandtii]